MTKPARRAAAAVPAPIAAIFIELDPESRIPSDKALSSSAATVFVLVRTSQS
jgi:hypothetical protein